MRLLEDFLDDVQKNENNSDETVTVDDTETAKRQPSSWEGPIKISFRFAIANKKDDDIWAPKNVSWKIISALNRLCNINIAVIKYSFNKVHFHRIFSKSFSINKPTWFDGQKILHQSKLSSTCSIIKIDITCELDDNVCEIQNFLTSLSNISRSTWKLCSADDSKLWCRFFIAKTEDKDIIVFIKDEIRDMSSPSRIPNTELIKRLMHEIIGTKHSYAEIEKILNRRSNNKINSSKNELSVKIMFLNDAEKTEEKQVHDVIVKAPDLLQLHFRIRLLYNVLREINVYSKITKDKKNYFNQGFSKQYIFDKWLSAERAIMSGLTEDEFEDKHIAFQENNYIEKIIDDVKDDIEGEIIKQ